MEIFGYGKPISVDGQTGLLHAVTLPIKEEKEEEKNENKEDKKKIKQDISSEPPSDATPAVAEAEATAARWLETLLM